MRKLLVAVGGVARGQPGEAAVGVVLTDEQGRVVEQLGKPIGRATTEAAEYKAVLEGLHLASQYQPEEIVLHTDNHQVANQLSGLAPVRDPAIQYLNQLALDLLARFPKWRVGFVDRDVNRGVRRLADQALRDLRQAEREREELAREIQVLLEKLTVEEMRRVHSFIRGLRGSGM